MWGKLMPDKEKLKQAWNKFYQIIKKVKKEHWQKFLDRKEEIVAIGMVELKDNNKYWKTLEYTKPRTNNTTLALKNLNDKIIVKYIR